MSAPTPACLAARRLALFGGSFDPVHAAHLRCAHLAREARALDHVVFVPAATPPHKRSVELAGGADRTAMLALALESEPAFSAWDVELERGGASYTIDTVRALAAARGGAEGLFWIVGGDNLAGLPSWRAIDELLALAQPIVVPRGEDTTAVLAALERELSQSAHARVAAGMLDVPPVLLSATELRERLARGEDPGTDLPPGVWAYVRARGIYRRP